MTVKKTMLLTLISAFLLTGCEIMKSESSTNESLSFTPSASTEPSVEPSVEPSIEPSVDLSGYEQDFFLSLNSFNIEVDETFNITPYLEKIAVINQFTVQRDSSNISLDNCVVKGIKVGNAKLYVFYNNYYHIIEVTVFEKSALNTTFKFEHGRLYKKNVLIFGDSVSDTANANHKKYFQLLADEYEYKYVNKAKGGTTITYAYEGSHIYDEYYKDFGELFYGVSYVNANRQDILRSHYIFIFYGHNDMYFQVPIGSNSDLPTTYKDCNTFKGSFNYCINTIRQINPEAKIILIGPNYSEYKPNDNYDAGITYDDYRAAIRDIAVFQQTRLYEPWDIIKEAKDSGQTPLQDAVHMNQLGHQLLADLIKNG